MEEPVAALARSREPGPESRGGGRIILLNGASSSGKSTLARALRDRLDEPFLHVSSDHLVAAGLLPERRDDGGPFDWWHQVRPRFFAGFHRCLPALAAAGNDLIVEHVIEFPAWRDELAALLSGLDVFLVGVHCGLEELERRERDRGDRTMGEGRSHVVDDRIHTFGPYDLEVDTTDGIDGGLVDRLLVAWRERTGVSVLFGERTTGPNVVIEPTSSVPPYEQLRAQLARQIHDRALAVGTRLPTVRGLAAELDLAVNTVARAYRELEEAGLIETRRRAGSFVSAAGQRGRERARRAAADYAAVVASVGLETDEALHIVRAALTR